MNTWFDDRDYFTGKTCISIAKYLESETGIKPEVHKTSSYLVVIYQRHGELKTCKLKLTSGVIYILKREDFKEIIRKMEDK